MPRDGGPDTEFIFGLSASTLVAEAAAAAAAAAAGGAKTGPIPSVVLVAILGSSLGSSLIWLSLLRIRGGDSANAVLSRRPSLNSSRERLGELRPWLSLIWLALWCSARRARLCSKIRIASRSVLPMCAAVRHSCHMSRRVL